MSEPAKNPLKLFYSYSHKDELFRKRLEQHLGQLCRQGMISEWNDRKLLPGETWAHEIDTHLKTASIILLLVSPDFLDSRYCYDVEMQHALERHKRGEARVIPIILRYCDWQYSPLKDLQCLPRDGKPVKAWPDRDKAFHTITQGLRSIIEHMREQSQTATPRTEERLTVPTEQQEQGFYQEGDPSYQETLTIQPKMPGEQHPKTLTSAQLVSPPVAQHTVSLPPITPLSKSAKNLPPLDPHKLEYSHNLDDILEYIGIYNPQDLKEPHYIRYLYNKDLEGPDDLPDDFYEFDYSHEPYGTLEEAGLYEPEDLEEPDEILYLYYDYLEDPDEFYELDELDDRADEIEALYLSEPMDLEEPYDFYELEYLYEPETLVKYTHNGNYLDGIHDPKDLKEPHYIRYLYNKDLEGPDDLPDDFYEFDYSQDPYGTLEEAGLYEPEYLEEPDEIFYLYYDYLEDPDEFYEFDELDELKADEIEALYLSEPMDLEEPFDFYESWYDSRWTEPYDYTKINERTLFSYANRQSYQHRSRYP